MSERGRWRAAGPRVTENLVDSSALPITIAAEVVPTDVVPTAN